MKHLLKICSALLLSGVLLSGCIKETFPEGSTATGGQIDKNPTAIVGYVNALRSYMIASGSVMGTDIHCDFAYPSLMLQRDLMGQDIAHENSPYTQFFWWYEVRSLGPDTWICQYPWSWYYRQIKQCNLIIHTVGDPEKASQEFKTYLGLAHFYRAFCYFDLARLYLQGNYVSNPTGKTVPIIDEKTVNPNLLNGVLPEGSRDETNNPRVPANEMFEFILTDMQKAETFLKDFQRPSKDYPDMSVIKGLYARIYLDMGNWTLAEQYAKDAQTGYAPLTEAQWTDKKTGFNSAVSQSSWMWGMIQTANENSVKSRLRNWSAHMCSETNWGYNGAGAGNFLMIDAHLFDLIGEKDFRRTSYIAPGAKVKDINTDFAPDPEQNEIPLEAFPTYTSIKFRPGGGQYTDYTQGGIADIPLMRVEEMMLIEAEAAGMQDVGRGRQLLETFVKTYRDPDYTASTTDIAFINDVWTQRRIELWGEGFASFDLKRLNKGITRSYVGTNHYPGTRFNTTSAPEWLNLCIVRNEGDFNKALANDNNPEPVHPDDSDPITW